MSTENQIKYADKTITCVDCKQPFTFTVNDQEFYATQVDEKTGAAWVEPKRCRACRERRKAAKAERESVGK